MVLGRVVGAWGVRGWVKVAPLGDGPEGLLAQPAWWLGAPGGEGRRRTVLEARAHSGTVVASLDGCATPEAAAELKGCEVAVPRSALPKARRGEVYLADLVGLDVVSASGRALGTVVAMEPYGAHPLMRVRGGESGGDPAGRLVPFVEPILMSVDLAARRIEVDWEPEY